MAPPCGRTRYGHLFSRGKAGLHYDAISGRGGPHDRDPAADPRDLLMGGPERLYQVLARSGRLVFHCPACGHQGEMTGKAALEIFGEMATPAAVRRRIRCSKCGSRRCEVKA